MVTHYLSAQIKGAYCEIFDRSGLHDFYTMKPFWIGDFGIKYKRVTLIFRGARRQFLAHTHSVRISS